MSDESKVLAANEAFYAIFAGRSLEAMEALWAEHAPVACIHPGWNALRGRQVVMASWKAILANPTSPRIQFSNATAHVMGDLAFVLCNESLSDAELIATNVFVREEGEWKLVHHHAGPVVKTDEQDKPPPGLLN